jgi:glycosyltransferase involved in cell wall biosynthesis
MSCATAAIQPAQPISPVVPGAGHSRNRTLSAKMRPFGKPPVPRASGRRILHAIHDFLPRHRAGSEIYTGALCRAQIRLGQHPTVLCAEVDPTQRQGRLRWRQERGVPVAEIVNNWAFASFDESWQSPRLEAQLAALLDILQPHVVHVHNLLNLSLHLPRLARARDIPVVATLHDYTLVCPSGGQRVHVAEQHLCRDIDPARCARCFRQSPFHTQLTFGRLAPGRPLARIATPLARVANRRLPRLTARAAAAIGRLPDDGVTEAAIRRRLDAARDVFDSVSLFVAPSRSLADEYLTLGLPPERLEISDYGFEPLPTAAAIRQPAMERLRVGFVGTLVWHKGAHLLVEALEHLPAERLEVCVFGDADVFPAYGAELRRRATGHPVRFEGPFDRERVGAVYGGFDVLVVPSLWLENSPLVIHEAFMAGVPVVGADIGGIADLVTDEVNGLLFEPGSAVGLARALTRLLEDIGLRERLAARHRAVKSIDQDARDWLARYDRVAATEVCG